MKSVALKQVSYDPAVFLDVENVEEAVRVILTPEEGMTSAHRWKTETPYLMSLIERFIRPEITVLDYGCGIGRLAKPIVEKLKCQVVGVDISPNMRALADSCVASDNFCSISPMMLCPDWVRPHSFDAAIAVWTLQHVLDLAENIETDLHFWLKDGGTLFVVNNNQRVLPSSAGWLDDGQDVHQTILDVGFELIERGTLEHDDIPKAIRANTFWAAYRKA